MMDTETRAEMQAFGNSEYDNGYRDGYAGRPYRGRTFIGYYGWCDGRDAANKENA